jgi:deoxyribonuclease-4
LKASIQRILDASRVAAAAGCWSICYHAAYYSKTDPQKVYDKVKEHLTKITATLHNEGHDIWVRPETGGKINQFADSYELIKLATELDAVLPCFDLAHQFSRTLGKWNTLEDFRQLFTAIEKHLGKRGLHNMHVHTEGIEYTDKGERNHVNLNQCKFNYRDLVKVWKEFKIKGVVVCESPNIEDDALLLKKTYEKA